MKYWRLYQSAEKEVGFVPQIVEPIFEGMYDDKNQLWNMHLKPIGKDTIIPKGHLHKKAKLTDLMSVGFGGNDIFVSDKLAKIIKGSLMHGVQFADSQIFSKAGECLKANIMHPFVSNNFFVDMQKTVFQISNIMGDIVFEQIKFALFEDFIKMQVNLREENKKEKDMNLHKVMDIAHLDFKDNIDIGICSLSNLTYGGTGFFVSQDLKDKILAEKCTGVIFRELNERYP